MLKFIKKIMPKKAKAIVKYLINNVLNSEMGGVIMLHRIENDAPYNLYDNEILGVSSQELERIILHYKKKNYQFLSLDELHELLSKGEKPKQKFICFTFDDGYIDNFEIAYPIFKKHNVPFCVYVTTDFPDHKFMLWYYVLDEIIGNNDTVLLGDGSVYSCKTIEEKNETFRAIREKIFELQTSSDPKILHNLLKNYEYSFEELIKKNALTWEQIKILSDDPICTIGAHTVNHLALNKISEEEVIYQLSESKKILEEKLQKPVYHFAYPYGACNDFVVKKVEEVGYHTATLSCGGMENRRFNMYKLKRIDIRDLGI